MFGIGYQEMFVVLVVAMVIFGPSRLPELAGQVGRWVRDFRRMSSDLTGEFSSTFSEIDEVKKSFERELKSAAGELENAGKSVSGKKPAAAKPAVAAKSAASGSKISTRSVGAKTGDSAAKSTASALDRNKMAKNGKVDTAALVATKDDPLADVSLFAVDFVAPTVSRNGKVAVVEDDALVRVRRRRAAAAYAKRASA
ncbi:MAG: Sec-independent protein translocase protein TatB [Chloroflexota bacterium]|nr:Sec-independent protein translocase protein TatB [Chloroflexota bacterium]